MSDDKPNAAEAAEESKPADADGGSAAGEASAAPPSVREYVAKPPRPEQPAYRPSYVFLVVVSVVSLALDLGTKAWAKANLEHGGEVKLIERHLSLGFARNMGGAFGMLKDESEWVRRPFFLIISVAAIAFIVSLYRKLAPNQTALKWGLPLVLGGALGNLVDRIRYGWVVDFIDYRADWVRWMYSVVGSNNTDRWPTFNIADVAICVGVGLMAVDMFQTRNQHKKPAARAVDLEGEGEAGARRAP